MLVNKNNSKVMLAAQRLKQFCVQFDRMTEKEKKECIERVDMLVPELLPELYNSLNEYMK